MYSPSLLRHSSMYRPTSATSFRSGPSTAITGPRISTAGLVGPGVASGGAILERTLILLRNGIVMTIASILRKWLRLLFLCGCCPGTCPGPESCVCKGGKRRSSMFCGRMLPGVFGCGNCPVNGVRRGGGSIIPVLGCCW